jgi:chromatin remodeling complex protein RSC6
MTAIMKAKLSIYDTEFDINGNNIKLKCNQNINVIVKNISNFNNLNNTSIRINNFNISATSNNIEIEYTENAIVNISYNSDFIQHSTIYKEPSILQKENPLLSKHNDINLLFDEIDKINKDPISKLIEKRKQAKIERMQKLDVYYYENFNNLSNENKECIINTNFKLLKLNNELLHLLGRWHYTLNFKKDNKNRKTINRLDNDKIIKKHYNTIEELMEINKENIKLFSKYEELQKLLEDYKNKLVKKVSQEEYILRKRKTYRKAPSGFCMPANISNELAIFLGKSIGTQMTRPEVSREINTYIRANKLQDVNNGRVIRSDKKLAILLKVKPTDELTYFNLQRFLAPHFKVQGK